MGTVVSAERVLVPASPRPDPLARVSDEALVDRIRRGDERAFEDLYGRYRDRLFRYCGSILRQPEDAEEAVQSAMLGAYRALVGGEARAIAVRPWLYRIAHNQCIGILRRRASRPTEPLTGLEVLPCQDVAQRVETADELTRLRQDLQSLPADQRSALVLRELSGLSHEQIALVLDEPSSTVKQLIYQARLGLHAMADGRALGCDAVRRRISDGDGRVLRSRGIGAHLRTCPTCRGFREGLETRPARLAALAPVAPLALGRDILGSLGGGGAAGGAALGGAGAAGGFSMAGAGLALKLALVVTVGIVGAGAVVAPRVIGEPARPEPASSAAHRHAVPLLQASPAASPAVAALTTANPPEVDAPPPLFDVIPPDAPSPSPATALAPAAGSVPVAAGAATAAVPAPAATPVTAAAPAAATVRTPARRAPGGASTTPGNGTPPPHSSAGGSRGNSGAPGQSGTAPGNSGSAPGQSGTAPGNSGSAPGHSGSAPGNSGSAPGQSGGAPPATPATPAVPAEPAAPAAAAGAEDVHGASAAAPGQVVADGAKAPKGPPGR